ncbi:MAG: MmgE/PrpD family protein [Thermodesulfobacteriota bacterium]
MSPRGGADSARLLHGRTRLQELSTFVHRAEWDGISRAARKALKIRVLDSLGCAWGAMEAGPIRKIRRHVAEFGGKPLCTLIGGGRTSPDRAAFYNSALIRYLDFNDSYLAKGETCHPSDNLGAVLAAAEYAGICGRELLASLAAAYQVQCRLSDVAPLRARGFDHVTQGVIAAAAGAGRALSLDEEQLANALAIAATANNAVRATRTGELSHWKGLAAPNAAFNGLRAAFLAKEGITGPAGAFEGPKGWMQVVSGPFEIDWEGEGLERVSRTVLKKYNAEIHSQSAIEGLLGMMEAERFTGRQIARIRVEIFDVAFLIIGGGAEGDKTVVRTKEEADHSLPYILAVAALDGEVTPAQYAPERILRDDVQELLRKVEVVPDPVFSARFPEEHACRLTVALRDGRILTREKTDYEGFHTRPMSMDGAAGKFRRVADGSLDPARMESVIQAVSGMENLTARELAGFLV